MRWRRPQHQPSVYSPDESPVPSEVGTVVMQCVTREEAREPPAWIVALRTGASSPTWRCTWADGWSRSIRRDEVKLTNPALATGFFILRRPPAS